MSFNTFKLAVAKQFSKMAQGPLFVTDVSGEALSASSIEDLQAMLASL